MRVRWIFPAFLTLASCTPLPVQPEYTERRVAVLPPGIDVWWFTLSRDGSTAAYAERRNSEAWMTVGNRRYGPLV